MQGHRVPLKSRPPFLSCKASSLTTLLRITAPAQPPIWSVRKTSLASYPPCSSLRKHGRRALFKVLANPKATSAPLTVFVPQQPV